MYFFVCFHLEYPKTALFFTRLCCFFATLLKYYFCLHNILSRPQVRVIMLKIVVIYTINVAPPLPSDMFVVMVTQKVVVTITINVASL